MVANNNPGTERQAGFAVLESLRYRDFRILWIGLLCGNVAMVFDFYTQPWYIVQSVQSNQNLMLGLLGLGRGVAMLIASMYGSALADRWDRRYLLLLTQGAAIAVKLLLSALIIFGSPELWQVLPLMFLALASPAIDQPVRQALATELVPRQSIPNAMALLMVAQMGAFVLVAPIVGSLIDHVGTGTTFAISLVGHVGSLGSLMFIHYRSLPGHGETASAFRGVREGLRYVSGQTGILWIIVLTVVTGSTGGPLISTLAASWMRNVLGVSSTGYTLMAWLWAISATVTALLLSSIGNVPVKGRLLLLSALGFGLSVILYAFSRSLVLTSISWVINGAMFTAANTTSLTIVQTLTANEYRARVMALVNLRFPAAQAAALPLGLAADAAGLTTVVPVMAIICSVLVILMAAAIPTLRRLDQIEAEAGDAQKTDVATKTPP